MAKARTKGKQVVVRYWMHDDGKMAITRGDENARDKKTRGFKEVGPATFARAAKAAHEAKLARMSEEVGLV